jgi:hypothetical protein
MHIFDYSPLSIIKEIKIYLLSTVSTCGFFVEKNRGKMEKIRGKKMATNHHDNMFFILFYV